MGGRDGDDDGNGKGATERKGKGLEGSGKGKNWMSEMSPLVMAILGLILIDLLFVILALAMVLHYVKNITRILNGELPKPAPFGLRWIDSWIDSWITELSQP